MRKVSIIILGVLICTLFVGIVIAENEPNDSLDSAEKISAGTFSGSVSYNLMSDDDEDFFEFTAPANTKITVTGKKTDGDYTIFISSYDEYKSEMSMFDGISMMLDDTGETDSQSFNNNANSAKTYYLGVSGDGDYKITLEIGDAGSGGDAIPHDDSDASCCSSALISSFGILIGIFVVLGLLKKRKMGE